MNKSVGVIYNIQFPVKQYCYVAFCNNLKFRENKKSDVRYEDDETLCSWCADIYRSSKWGNALDVTNTYQQCPLKCNRKCKIYVVSNSSPLNYLHLLEIKKLHNVKNFTQHFILRGKFLVTPVPTFQKNKKFSVFVYEECIFYFHFSHNASFGKYTPLCKFLHTCI